MNWSSNNDSFNFTDHSKECVTLLGTIVTWNLTVYLFLLVIAATVNVLLLLAIYKDPQKCLRHPTNYFIANLAVADLLNSLFYLEEVLLSQTKYKSTGCFEKVLSWRYVNAAFGFFIYFLTFPSVTSLALERYVSVAHPIWHQVNFTSRLCCKWIAVVWLINGLFTVISGIFIIPHAPDVIPCYPSVFYVSTLLIYAFAFISIRKQRQRLSTNTTISDVARQMMELRLSNENSFLATVLIVNLFLIFGVIPTVIAWYLSDVLVRTESASVDLFFFIIDILFYINIAANPFLYIWRLPKYRKTFFVMYCCKNII
jgi:hypothetical protein